MSKGDLRLPLFSSVLGLFIPVSHLCISRLLGRLHDLLSVCYDFCNVGSDYISLRSCGLGGFSIAQSGLRTEVHDRRFLTLNKSPHGFVSNGCRIFDEH